MIKTRPFGGVGVRRMRPVCTQPCIRLSRVLGMLTERIRKRYRDCYVIRAFNNGSVKPPFQMLQIVKPLPFHIPGA